MAANTQRVSVLLTSAGLATAVNVIQALRREAAPAARIVAVDMEKYAAGLHLAESGHLVPPCSHPEYLDLLLDICRREEVRFVYPLYSGEISLFAANAHRFREAGIGMMIPPADTVATCVDKRRFLQFCEAEGFAFPRTYDPAANPEYVYPLFMKPVSGSSSRNAFRVDAPEDLAYLLAKHPRSLVQEFIPGMEYTVDCLMDAGRLLACVPRTRLVVKDGKSMVGKTVEHPALVAEVERLLRAVGMHGPCNVQWMEDASGRLYLIEINPRLAAGGLPLAVAAGANIPHMMLKLALGETVQPVTGYRRDLVMVRYLDQVFVDAGAGRQGNA